MLVQLSPWQSVKTSLAVAKVRRKRSDSQSSDSESNGVATVVASFVPPVRRSSKRKKGPSIHARDEVVPSLAITSAHRVSILGRRIKSDDEQGASQVFQESSQWQYSSRPGRSTSFLQESLVNGNSKKGPHPSIPAVMDAKNNRVYAFQNDNSTLCCWDATKSSGPDDSDSSTVVKIPLTTPALSLSLHNVRTGIVYGTCVDGLVFVGRWICDLAGRPETLQVHYLGTLQSKSEHRVSTTATTTAVSNKSAGHKRKANEANQLIINIHQMFLSQAGRLRLLKHEFSLPTDEEGAAMLTGENTRVQEAAIELLSTDQGSITGSRLDLQSATACPTDSNTVALLYHSVSRDAIRGCSCAHICLETGRLKRTPFMLPPSTRHVVALSSSVIVAGTTDHIVFCDLMNGTVMQSIPVSHVVGEETSAWNLVADRRLRRIAILCYKGDRIKASLTTATLGGGSSTLATGLRSSLALSFSSGLQLRRRTATRELTNIGELCCDTEPLVSNTKARLAQIIDQALESLKACRPQILNPAAARLEAEFFLKEYERALVIVLSAANSPQLERSDITEQSLPACVRKDVADNPQDAIISSTGSQAKPNHSSVSPDRTRRSHESYSENASNYFHSGRKGVMNGIARQEGKLVNGLKVNASSERVGAMRAYTPSSTPQRFIDGVTPIVLSILQLPRVEDKVIGWRVHSARLDARLVLSRLLQSGKVSARRHFETNTNTGKGSEAAEDIGEYGGNYFLSVLRAVKLTKKRRRIFSPVDMMHDMLSGCSDLSERLLVTMIDYMLCRALPEDVAENLIESRRRHHPDSFLSKRYFKARTRLVRASQNTSPNTGTDIQQLQADVDELANKLLKAGATFLVSRIAAYSRCNDTLLRGALLEGFTTRQGPVLLAYILADLLSSAGRDANDSGDPRYKDTRASCATITQWIAALCDTYRDRLQGLTVEVTRAGTKEPSPIEYLHRVVSAALEQTEAVMSLRDAFEHSTEEIYSQGANGGEQDLPEPQLDEKSDQAAIPPYSIERLVF